ncbi:hypothetical protein [Haloparvum sedimenti]|uniref:hypothetical protein n=1 Tax=Haloparvum sedimenti TaxID=1678448 RepID=UPI00071E727B|nr:hypothetical protein [Haloparvum sedimenti]
MNPPESRRWCLLLLGVGIGLLTVGIGYLLVVGTTLADFLVIVAGLLLVWIGFIYCFAHLSGWRE